MATYSQLKTQVESDLNRTDFSAEVSWAVFNAIRHYEGERWPWLEEVTTVQINTNQSWVTPPLDMDVLDLVMFQDVSSTERYEIPRRDIRALERVDGLTASTVGRPTWYSFYDGRIRVYPTMDATSNLVLFYKQSLVQTGPHTDAHSNHWTNIASPLIYARAAWQVALTKIHDPELAMMYKALENETYAELESRFRLNQSKGRATRHHHWPISMDYALDEAED